MMVKFNHVVWIMYVNIGNAFLDKLGVIFYSSYWNIKNNRCEAQYYLKFDTN